MIQRKIIPARPCRIFLCYRRENALAAITFKGIMDRDSEHEYGNIWYSNLESVGNFILDIPEMIGETEWIIFFIGKEFTAGFLDENEINPDCVTAKELIAIEKERQKRKAEGKPFHFMTVNVDDGYLDRQCAKDLKQLFLVAGILKKDSVMAYTGLNQNPYHSASTLPHDYIEKHIAPYCALPLTMAGKIVQEPRQATETIKDSAPETGVNTVIPESDANEADPLVPGYQAITNSDGVKWASPDISNTMEAIQAELKWMANGNVLFGSYPQTREGRKQPIEWLVLKREKKQMLLISRYVLDAKPYNDTQAVTTWAECTLEKWLNGAGEHDFLQVAFTDEEREQILISTALADHNPSYYTKPGKPVNGRVFILSIPEANRLFPSDESRRCIPTDYAKKQGVYTSEDYQIDGLPTCWWWLRSPGYDSHLAACVYLTGTIDESGDIVDSNYLGVRPAFWIKLNP